MVVLKAGLVVVCPCACICQPLPHSGTGSDMSLYSASVLTRCVSTRHQLVETQISDALPHVDGVDASSAAKDMLCSMTSNSSTQWGARPCARNKHTSVCLRLSVTTSGEECRRKGEPVDIQPFLENDVYWIVISSVPGRPREAPKRRWPTDRESNAYEPCTLIFFPNTDHSTSHTLQ